MILRTPRDIGSAIRDRRRRLGLDQDELAKRVGVSRKWIIDVEKGKPGIAMNLLLRTLDALGMRFSLTTDDNSTVCETAASLRVFDIDRVLENVRSGRK